MQAFEMAEAVAVPYRRLSKDARQEALGALARGWQGIALLVLIGCALGGYLGGLSVLYAWTFGRRVVLDGSESVRRRVTVGVLTAASAGMLYSCGLSVYLGFSSL